MTKPSNTKALTQKELERGVAEAAGISRASARRALRGFGELALAALAEQRTVTVPAIGRIKPRIRPAGRRPDRDGRLHRYPARGGAALVLSVRASGALNPRGGPAPEARSDKSDRPGEPRRAGSSPSPCPAELPDRS